MLYGAIICFKYCGKETSIEENPPRFTYFQQLNDRGHPYITLKPDINPSS